MRRQEELIPGPNDPAIVSNDHDYDVDMNEDEDGDEES